MNEITIQEGYGTHLTVRFYSPVCLGLNGDMGHFRSRNPRQSQGIIANSTGMNSAQAAVALPKLERCLF